MSILTQRREGAETQGGIENKSGPPDWFGPALAAARHQDSLTGQRLPCITLYLPWAYFVMRGWKPIETRTHSRFAKLAGKTIGIHASCQWERDNSGYVHYLTREQHEEARAVNFREMCGLILGTVLVGEHRPLNVADEPGSLIECKTPRWGLFLLDVKPFQTPIKARGRQGIWYHQL